MARDKKFIVISSREEPHLEWGRALSNSMGVCHTCSKAYEIALFLAGITKPDKKYRKVLDTIKIKGAAQVKQIDGDAESTIVLVKVY